MATRPTTLRSRRSRTRRPAWRQPALLSMIGGGIVVLGALTWWGGAAQQGPQFWLGAGLQIALLGGFALLLWWLFLSRLPFDAQVDVRPNAKPNAATRPNAAARQFVALLATVSGVLFITGATWEEVWRQLYGVRAALDDFWWRPHLLTYGSLAVNALLALAALFYATPGAGGLRPRFRTDPLIGVVGLVSAYMALTAWANLLWHRIYGLDTTAWSPPHILTALNMLLLMLAAAAVQASVLPRAAAWTTRRLGLGEINVAVQLAIATTALLLVGVTEYDTLSDIGAGPILQAFRALPAWLYPAIVLAVGLFAGNVALQLLRRPGAATLVMLAVLCYRALLLAVFQSRNPDFGSTASSQFLILLPAAGLDLVYFFRQQTADERQTLLLANLTGITLMLTLGLMVLPRLLTYPPVTEQTIPWMVVMGALVGLWAGWCGAAAGGALERIHRLPPLPHGERLRVAALAGGICAGLVAFTVFFVVTATPPA